MVATSYSANAPIYIGRVGLVARDAAGLSRYYQQVVGLNELAISGAHITLGAGDRPLLEIEQSAAVRPDDPRSAGLYHTAFLLPSRADLGRWIGHARESGIALVGSADHLVSEAVYLTDPEGNGIEIYADRDPATWPRDGDTLRMANAPLDWRGIMASVPEGAPAWTGAPAGTIVGHVHLRVGDVRKAEEWWNGEAGFDTVLNYGSQAVFLSTGGYHHHIGANSWQSQGAGMRDADRAGLRWIELLNREPAPQRQIRDPWGTEIRFAPAA